MPTMTWKQFDSACDSARKVKQKDAVPIPTPAEIDELLEYTKKYRRNKNGEQKPCISEARMTKYLLFFSENYAVGSLNEEEKQSMAYINKVLQTYIKIKD